MGPHFKATEWPPSSRNRKLDAQFVVVSAVLDREETMSSFDVLWGVHVIWPNWSSS